MGRERAGERRLMRMATLIHGDGSGPQVTGQGSPLPCKGTVTSDAGLSSFLVLGKILNRSLPEALSVPPSF